jgi:hypothetical protein
VRNHWRQDKNNTQGCRALKLRFDCNVESNWQTQFLEKAQDKPVPARQSRGLLMVGIMPERKTTLTPCSP